MATKKTTTNSKVTKVTKPTKSKTSSATVSKKTTKKVTKITTPVETTNSSINFNSIKAKAIEIKDNKKTLPIAVVVVGLITLAILASKYLVVAWVGNSPITRIGLYQEMEKRYGKDTREQLIMQQLINDEAKSKGISVSDAEIATEIQNIQKEQGGADKLNEVLKLQNISQTDFKDLVKMQLLRQKMFGTNVEVTDKELEDYLTQNKDQLPETVDDKMKADIKNNLKQQKVAQNFNTWLQEALKSSKVKRI